MSKALNIRLDETTYAALTARAAAQESTMTDLVRLAIAAYLATDTTVPVMSQATPPTPRAILHTTHINGGAYHVRCGYCGAVYVDDGDPRGCQSCRRR